MMLSIPHPLDACWLFGFSFSQKKTGFSLIEMLVYLSLFSVVALAIMAFNGYFPLAPNTATP
jgi:prepilin-type N-terminal cleavage/methylation domain-containing protein